MGILQNSKHEAFAQCLARGMTASAAYQSAGYKPNRGNASVLKANQSIQGRVRELAEDAAGRAAKSLDDVIAEYERIAFSGMSRFLKINQNGDPAIDLTDCTPMDLDLLAEVTPTIRKAASGDDAELVSLKIKLGDRFKALDKLAMHLGMGNEKVNRSSNALSEAIIALAQRGSPIPVASERRVGPQGDRGS